MLRAEYIYFRPFMVIVEDVQANTPWLMRLFMFYT